MPKVSAAMEMEAGAVEEVAGRRAARRRSNQGYQCSIRPGASGFLARSEVDGRYTLAM